jgi:chromosome segregation protein
MQLSKLEIKGFKSFGEKVVINFDAGITGIVGPNGCGKSNVVDAIRWVLGEQSSRALRSEKMENVIFNGTKNRKPQQLAEVSLTFNNTKNLLPTEYSQVTISRRYYRSGESEYLLNNVPCRLKDINNLFLDTGIGSDSYAIIELGMVDDILNNKDNSRRSLFEEAAGVSKFKIRKKESLRKLEATAQDLERVEDLLFEINKNLKSLEKQAKQTENYFQYKKEYKRLSVVLARKTVARQLENVEQIKSRLLTEQERRSQLTAQIAEKEALAEKEKVELVQKEKLLASRQRTLNEKAGAIRQYENEKNIKNERLRFLNEKIKNLTAQIEQDRQNNLTLQQDLERLSAEKNLAQAQLAEQETTVKDLQTAYETRKTAVQALQQETTEASRRFRQQQEESYKLRKSLDIKQTQLDTLRQELDRNSENTELQTAKIEAFDDEILALQKQLSDAETQATKDQQTLKELKTQLDTLHENTESLRQEVAHRNRLLDARQNEYNLTKSLVENLEGFPEAIKFLRQQVREMKNAPLLQDLLTCPDAYRIAVENFLEPYMNFFVVATQQQALQMVNLLNDSAKGRANFFVLEHFEKYISETSEKSSDIQGVKALSVVEFDIQYAKLIHFLLDNVWLVQTETALTGNGEKIYLSENGKIIKRPLSISGGSVGLFEGKRIGRARNLENLSEEIKKLSADLQTFSQQLSAHQQEKQKLQHQLLEGEKVARNSQNKLQTVKQEVFSASTRQEQLRELASVQALRREEMYARLQDLQSEAEELRPEAEEKEEAVQEAESQVQALQQDLQAENEILSQQSQGFNQQNLLYHQQKNKVGTLEQEITFKTQNTQAGQQRLERNETDLTQTQSDLKILLESNEIQEDKLVEMYREKETITQGVQEAEQDYYKSRGEIDKLEKEVRETQRQRETTDALLQEWQNKRNDEMLQLTAVRERLSVEFEVNLNAEFPESEQDTELSALAEDTLREKVSGIKNQIEKLGAINPLALEAFNEMKERHDFIVAQRQDLDDARNSLLQTIAEIDAVAKENFMVAFAAIRENFIKVFRSLFSEEDSCDLTLSDANNPLEADIDIIAKPRGKRPLTINQLSGGEKTLTAISLLFAIYLIKPAPFCIFDEVDAPLDDANIDKFNTIIKKFSADSQFIIVTHNKRTMTSVDIIYGVSMMAQDYGVSRVVPVDLRELA